MRSRTSVARAAAAPGVGEGFGAGEGERVKHDGSVERTARILHANGFAVDWPLWEHDYGKCGPCHPGANCH
ncbi:hypothetical protein [Streptomyces xiaopingdaonensis]|uniref:hypothetical protein n=1 Tax=Streptomyces xiaopingdaonensis TaxID=1565415 RepID=UPI000380B73B|nr:hypothetical protein [Streptomyces xiaopingdaonensis]